MSGNNRDPAIKLFGKTIPLPLSGDGDEDDKDFHAKEVSFEEKDEAPSADQEESAAATEATNSQEKAPPPKKPDKILPCPRCNSMDTKFCYYNNYNVNQPRYFCKNCQRYWTAGGTMRNVPVGAGRRKNKNSSSQFRHQLTVADACVQSVRSDVHQPSKPNSTVLSFGSSDTPLCESMASVLNLADGTTMKNCHQSEKIIPFACGDENSGVSLMAAAAAAPAPLNSSDDRSGANLQEPKRQSTHRIPAPVPCFNGSPWPYPWAPAPAFCASIPLYPAPAYWGCAVPPNWNIPWVSPVASSSAKSDSSAPNSPALGKHSRDGDVLNHRNSEKEGQQQERCLWLPKTLRIDNPDEAAKSSIWAMIGTRDDKTDETRGRSLFKAFQPKAEMKKDYRRDTSQALHANPAALSRSLSFQESS